MVFLANRERSSIKSKRFFRWGTGFVVALLLVAVLLFESQIEKDVISQVDYEFTETSQRLEQIVNSTILGAKSDIRFLHATPPISGMPRAFYNEGVDPYDGTTYKQWKERIETIFIGFIENNLAIEQLRIIEVTAQGNELVRVQRRGAAVEAVPDFSLQPKGDAAYFLPSSQLANGQIYLAPLSLNREFGELTFPYRPQLRFVLPIYSEQGKRFAFLIMNLNANALIESLKQALFNNSQLIISDSKGNFIYHPIESYRFSRDLAPNITWQNVYSQPPEYLNLYPLSEKDDKGEQYYVKSKKVQTRTSTKHNYIDISLLTSKKHVDSLINQKRLSTYSFLLIIVIFMSILLYIFYRNAIRSQMLADARKESSAIVDGSIDAIIGLNLSGQLTSLNFTAERLLSISRGTSIGRDSSEIALLDKLPIDSYINDLKNNKPQIKDERAVEIFAKAYHFAIAVSPVFTEENQLSGLALIVRDISKEKEADIKVKRLNSELEAKVRKRTHALAHAKDQAVKNSDVKSAFISNISHELKTSLNYVTRTLSILQQEELPEKSQNLLTTTDQSIANLNLLIHDILDLSKIESGQLEFNLIAFNPQTLIERLVETSAVSAFDKGLDVYLDTRNLKCKSAIADTLRLAQIVNNLISNAIKFTDQGFVKVSASSEDVNGKQIKLTVCIEDSGVGLDRHSLNSLSKLFNQADNSIEAASIGTGVGLSICKQLCQLMGGDIEVSSTLNKGSVFSFHVYIEGQSQHSSQDKKAYESTNTLVVNNNKHSREFIGELIESEGGHAELLQCNELDRAKRNHYDLVFLDMRDDSTNQLSSIIEQLTLKIPDIKIALLYKPSEPIPKAIKAKVIAISKPLTYRNLLKAIGYSQPMDKEPHDVASGPNEISQYVIQQIDGCSILIVDDNAINIDVACGVLEGLPLIIKTAENGVEALEALKASESTEHPISCILIDCEMPILDGYQTCLKIRSGQAGTLFKEIPIIAMTANASIDEKGKCLSAGMNDYVSKPFKTQVLQDTLIKWILSNYENDAQLSVQTEPEASELWDREATLARLLNKEVLLNKICNMFIVTAPEKFVDLKKFISDKNYEEVRLCAHSLKGLSGEVGAKSLRQHFAEIEVQAKDKQLNVDKQLELIEEQLPKLIAQMGQYL